jgi:hypothetical protein
MKIPLKTKVDSHKWLVISFGLFNETSIFISTMHQVFQKYIDKFVIVYFEDNFTFVKNTREYTWHLRMVLQGTYI